MGDQRVVAQVRSPGGPTSDVRIGFNDDQSVSIQFDSPHGGQGDPSAMQSDDTPTAVAGTKDVSASQEGGQVSNSYTEHSTQAAASGGETAGSFATESGISAAITGPGEAVSSTIESSMAQMPALDTAPAMPSIDSGA